MKPRICELSIKKQSNLSIDFMIASNNQILTFIPIFSFFIFPGDISDFFSFFVSFERKNLSNVES